MIAGCSTDFSGSRESDETLLIYPDYSSITVPVNIAPLNFKIENKGDHYYARFYNEGGQDFTIGSGNGNIIIPPGKWKKLLSGSESGDYRVDIFIKRKKEISKLETIINHVSPDSIDNFIVYRLIEPGFETWNRMGIYQRNLQNFREEPVMLNNLSDGNCLNCHTFRRNSGEDIMFHMRGTNGGTVIYSDGKLKKVNTKTDSTISAGVYPSWHPSGDYIAFSVNNIVQSFHAIPGKKIEVYDTLSNIVVYDINNDRVFSGTSISDPEMLETFPSWSPDGKYLYFCSAEKKPMSEYDQIRYDLMRVAFDPETLSFGDAEPVLKLSDKGKSVSFPRISPDNRYLLFCMADYGNFTIWHPESDIYLLDLETGDVTEPDINTDRTESFHEWSSTGRWIVFSSRRDDGLYTRPYFSYFDRSGESHKPFLLPQKDPSYYFESMKSFNIPELVTKGTALNPRKLAKISEEAPLNTSFLSR